MPGSGAVAAPFPFCPRAVLFCRPSLSAPRWGEVPRRGERGPYRDTLFQKQHKTPHGIVIGTTRRGKGGLTYPWRGRDSASVRAKRAFALRAASANFAFFEVQTPDFALKLLNRRDNRPKINHRGRRASVRLFHPIHQGQRARDAGVLRCGEQRADRQGRVGNVMAGKDGHRAKFAHLFLPRLREKGETHPRDIEANSLTLTIQIKM